jgi:hypothetical protein
MTLFSKATIALAAVSTAFAAMPAEARGRGWDNHGDGISAGDVIAGALVIGGIAAIASAASNNDRGYGRGYGRDYGRNDGRDGRGYDRGYDNNDYGYNREGYGSRQAVDQCIRAAQREAGRSGWARVTDVTTINRVRGGYEVRGRLVVEDRGGGRNWRGGNDRYGYNYDRYNDGYDKGRFSCVARYGTIEGVRVSGLRGGYYG